MTADREKRLNVALLSFGRLQVPALLAQGQLWQASKDFGNHTACLLIAAVSWSRNKVAPSS